MTSSIAPENHGKNGDKCVAGTPQQESNNSNGETNSNRRRVLVVYGSLSSFVRTDLKVLSAQHSVRELHFRRDGAMLPVSVLKAVAGVIWSDVTISWFGAVHGLVPFILARILRRKCIVIAGGYDSAAVPEIGYGNMRGGIRRRIGLMVFRLADRVLAFSQSAAREILANAKVPKEKLRVIELGIPIPPEDPSSPSVVTRHGAMTVGIVNQSNLTRKGIATFVAAARHLPDVPFLVVGRWSDRTVDELKASASRNVEFLDWVPDEVLRQHMRRNSVYVQASAHEAFGVALAEAMLMGCVPVVTDRGSLREVAGPDALYVAYGDAQGTATAIKCATTTTTAEVRGRIRNRIVSRFSVETRQRRLAEQIEQVLQSVSTVRS